MDYQTPMNVAYYMASLIPEKAVTVLEPTCGIGNLVNALESKGFDVDAPSNYFLLDSNKKYDCVVMNPPFSAKSAFFDEAPDDFPKDRMSTGYAFLNECMKKSENIIALMPWFTISDSDVRLRKLKKFGLKSVTLLPRKTFDYTRIQTCVFELENGYQEETIFKVFDLLDQTQKTLTF